jgi:hypothetical protein
LGARHTRLDVALVEKLMEHAASVQLVRLTSSGRNALDFALSYYLGRAVLSDPTAYFHVVSRDKGFDPLIEHLRSRHIHAHRHDDFTTLTFSDPTKVATAPPDDLLPRVLEYLKTKTTNRPKGKAALIKDLCTPVADDLDTEILFDDTHCVAAGARSRWVRRRKVTLAELVNEPWIFPATQVIDALIAEAFQAHGLKVPQERVSASSILLRNHLLESGRFLTILPSSVMRYNARKWSLKALPIDLGVKPRPVAIVTLKNRTLSPAVELFVGHVRSIVKTLMTRSAPGGRVVS